MFPEDAGSRWVELVERLRAGEAQASEELYHQLSFLRFSFFRNLGIHDGEDAYHELMLALIRQIRQGDLRQPDRLVGYARAIAANIVRNGIRANQKTRAREFAAPPEFPFRDSSPTPEAQAILHEHDCIATRILQTIPPRDREVLVRFYLQNQSADQIQTDMHLSETQFRLIKSRSKQRLSGLVQARLQVRRAGHSHGAVCQKIA